jgi:dCTP deaminase
VSFWSGEKIKEYGDLHGDRFISDFDVNQIDCNAYTLRMGREYFVTTASTDPARGRNQRHLLDPYVSFVIPAGQFAFLLTRETLDVPKEVMAFISMKATYKFQGLINVSGFHVDPGYRCPLVFAVYNAGPAPVHLREGLPLFLVWFADLDRASKKTRPANTDKALDNNLLKGMSGEIYSLQELLREIANLRRDMRIQWTIFVAAAGIFALVVGSILSFAIPRGLTAAYEFLAIGKTQGAVSPVGAAPAPPPTQPPATQPQAPAGLPVEPNP